MHTLLFAAALAGGSPYDAFAPAAAPAPAGASPYDVLAAAPPAPKRPARNPAVTAIFVGAAPTFQGGDDLAVGRDDSLAAKLPDGWAAGILVKSPSELFFLPAYVTREQVFKAVAAPPARPPSPPSPPALPPPGRAPTLRQQQPYRRFGAATQASPPCLT